MRKGHSLHIGLNKLDPSCYGNWEGKLFAAEADAKAMEGIAKSQGFKTSMLTTEKARRAAVLESLSKVSSVLDNGDIFLLTYAGHGGQVPDTSGDEIDQLDETWCLYDGQLLDDELTVAFSKFKAGVRILVVSDSCHSGTVHRGDNIAVEQRRSEEGIGFRCMYSDEMLPAYRTNRKFYDEIKRDIPTPLPKPKASIKCISACHDDQSAADGRKNGFFTENLIKTWKNGEFNGNYNDFFSKIESKMKWKTFWNGKNQSPVFIREEPEHDIFDKPFGI